MCCRCRHNCQSSTAYHLTFGSSFPLSEGAPSSPLPLCHLHPVLCRNEGGHQACFGIYQIPLDWNRRDHSTKYFFVRMVRMFSNRVVWNESFKTILLLQPLQVVHFWMQLSTGYSTMLSGTRRGSEGSFMRRVRAAECGWVLRGLWGGSLCGVPGDHAHPQHRRSSAPAPRPGKNETHDILRLQQFITAVVAIL